MDSEITSAKCQRHAFGIIENDVLPPELGGSVSSIRARAGDPASLIT